MHAGGWYTARAHATFLRSRIQIRHYFFDSSFKIISSVSSFFSFSLSLARGLKFYRQGGLNINSSHQWKQDESVGAPVVHRPGGFLRFTTFQPIVQPTFVDFQNVKKNCWVYSDWLICEKNEHKKWTVMMFGIVNFLVC